MMSDALVASGRNKRDFFAIIALVLLEVALVVSWSAGFVGMRFAIDHAPVFLILLWRNLVSGLVLLPIALMKGPRLQWPSVRSHMLFGALAMSANLALFALALSYGVPTGLVALISDMLPMMVAILSWPVLGQTLTRRQWLGSIIGLAGILIASAWSLKTGHAPPWAYGLPAIGTLALAMATLLQKRSPANAIPVYQSLCIQCLTASAIFAFVAWQEGGVAPVLDVHFIGGVLWLVFIATIAAGSLYFTALRRSSPARVTAVLYMSPPVTMIWAWVMFGEPLSWPIAIGLLVSLSGIVILARAQQPSTHR
jgi:drug/metabolite transporter (DMT)-like permease